LTAFFCLSNVFRQANLIRVSPLYRLGQLARRRARFPGRCGQLRPCPCRRRPRVALACPCCAAEGQRHGNVRPLGGGEHDLQRHHRDGAKGGNYGAIGLLALAVNLGVAGLLYRYRTTDSQALSVWLCTRNDCIANVAVMLAGAGVWAAATAWPDIAVAAIIAGLGLSSAVRITRQALREMRSTGILRGLPAELPKRRGRARRRKPGSWRLDLPMTLTG
jgi:hypothetical protein